MKLCALVMLLAFVVSFPTRAAQTPAQPPASSSSSAVDFDVVSIKKNTGGSLGGGMRGLADGAMVMTNEAIRSIISGASAESTREIEGLPDWATTERYDVTLKPPAGATAAQQRVMMQRMFADRFKAVVHVEQRERDGFSLVLARSDGKLGPNLKLSTLDCGPRPPGTPPEPPGPPPAPQDAGKRCGGMVAAGRIVSGGMPIPLLGRSLQGVAGGPIDDQTGLTGFYELELNYSIPRPAEAPTAPTATAADPTDAPNIFTALQEQLGLKLQPQKVMIPVLVIDHLERPTEN